MQCVILAAGEGTRMRPLTLEKPKPLISVCGKPILEHVVAALPESIDEIVLVVSYKAHMIRGFCGEEFLRKRVTYVVQENPKGGTGDAVLCARDVVHGTFMILNGDDIHGAEALAKAVGCEAAILTARSATPELFGVIELNEDGTFHGIVEKPKQPPSDLINTGGFLVSEAIFEHIPKPSPSGEVYLTDMVTEFAKTHPLSVIEQSLWLPLGRPEDIPLAEAVLCPKN